MFPGFQQADFALFDIEGFEARMTALRARLSPKFAMLGEELKSELSAMVGDELFPHVAKHARRTTNAPNDSWVAFGGKRGYKMGPHFQICVWSTHVLIQWGLIYEARQKATFAVNLMANLDEIRRIVPQDYQWSKDHMKPGGTRLRDMTNEDFADLSHRLMHNKNGEVMVGEVVAREEAMLMTPAAFHDTVIQAWKPLVHLHRMAMSSRIQQ